MDTSWQYSYWCPTKPHHCNTKEKYVSLTDEFIWLRTLLLHPGLAEIPAPDGGTGGDIINQIKWSPILSSIVWSFKAMDDGRLKN